LTQRAGKLIFRGFTLLSALSFSLGLPLAPSYLIAFSGHSYGLSAFAETDSASNPITLKQGEPEPLERADGGGITGGVRQNGGSQTTATGDDDGESSSILPNMPDRGGLVVGGSHNSAAGSGDQSTSASVGSGQDSANRAIRLPGDNDGGESSSMDGSDSAQNSTSASSSEGGFNQPALNTSVNVNGGQLTLPSNEFIVPAGGLLHGRVSETPERSPLLSGAIQTIPDGIKVDLTLQGNLNSEISQKGSEVFAQISRDVTDSAGNKVYLPGGWVAHGFVTARSGQKRHSGAGWAEITFDRIISPDGKYDVPFDAKLSTKDNTVVAVTKVLATDTKYMSMGAVAGGVLSVQMTGLPLAVASHGYSVAIGAAIGAGIGLAGAIRKKGPILSLYPGEHLKLTTAGSIQMPGFNLANLPSAKPKERVVGLFVQINEARMFKDTLYEDKKARVLSVNVTIENHTQREFLLNNLRVVSELNEIYGPHLSMMGVKFKPLSPTSSQTVTVPFSVDAGKHQYWLLLTDAKGEEVRREPIKITTQLLDKF